MSTRRGSAVRVGLGLGLAVLLSMLGSGEAAAQLEAELKRPVPGPVVAPRAFRAAVRNGTRSDDGSPGPAYWQNSASYVIDASLDPATGLLRGSATIEYFNEAPGDLQLIGMHLYQNLHAAGVVRNEAQEVTGGVTLERLAVDGVELEQRAIQQQAGYVVDGTALYVRPENPVAQGGSATVEIDWSVTLPQNGAGRMGHSEREVYFVAYWFPKIAVLDDLNGWDIEPYQGNSEFYDEFADYDVSLTVPGGWTLMATGELQNPEEVYSERVRDRLEAAAVADTVVRVASRREVEAGEATVDAELLTYRFTAERVRDFTFTTSNVQTWDATSAVVADRDMDGRTIGS